MAAETYSPNLDLDAMFETAKTYEMTKSGEMFSATCMRDLAQEMLNCNAETVNTESFNADGTRSKLISALMNGEQILVP